MKKSLVHGDFNFCFLTIYRFLVVGFERPMGVNSKADFKGTHLNESVVNDVIFVVLEVD